MTTNKPIHEISEKIAQWMNEEFTWDDRTHLSTQLYDLIEQPEQFRVVKMKHPKRKDP